MVNSIPNRVGPCKQWYHPKCMDVPDHKIAELAESNQPWFCNFCIKNVNLVFIIALQEEQSEQNEGNSSSGGENGNKRQKKRAGQTGRVMAPV